MCSRAQEQGAWAAHLVEASAELVVLRIQVVALVHIGPELLCMWFELFPVGVQEPSRVSEAAGRARREAIGAVGEGFWR